MAKQMTTIKIEIPDCDENVNTSELLQLLISTDKPKKREAPRRVQVGVQCKVRTRDVGVSFRSRKDLPIGFKRPVNSCVSALQEDLENYHYWKLMKGRPILKSTANLKLNSSEPFQNSENIQESSELEKLLTSQENTPPRHHVKGDFYPSTSKAIFSQDKYNLDLRAHQCVPVVAISPIHNEITGVDATETANTCRCCLSRPPVRDLRSRYIYLDNTEILSEIIEDCFNIQLTLDNEECGICEVCLVRLRDARDFKLQVQRSQAELQARLERAELRARRARMMPDKDEESSDNCEMVEDWLDEDVLMSPTLEEVPVLCEPTSSHAEPNGASDIAPYACPTCRQTFRREATLAAHIRDHTRDTQHDSDSSNESTSLHTGDISTVHTEETKYICDNCDKQFTRKYRIIEHMKTHEIKAFSCEYCPKRFTRKRYLISHTKHHTREIFICDMCNKKFMQKNYLIAHVASHMGFKPYSCKICKKRFKHINYLNIHKHTHAKNKPFLCEICNKRFAHTTLLEQHKRIHDVQFNCVCEICGKNYINKKSFEIHTLIHKGQKDYACDICQKQFYTKSCLISHIRTHTALKRFRCTICFKRFSTKSTLKCHNLTHTGIRAYSCDICSKRFYTSSSLGLHRLVHTGERPHRCDVCGNRFRRMEHLKRHLITHKERKFYTCELCNKVYSNLAGFQQHIRNHRKELDKA